MTDWIAEVRKKEADLKEAREVVEDLVRQFAYEGSGKDGPTYFTGGLSTLEDAFRFLGWEDPHPCPENKCHLCNEFATCGTPLPSTYTVGYARVCFKHFEQIKAERDLEKAHGPTTRIG